jgi:peptidyl-prolyl cis-trans isomerase B (cyclophilin B)
MQNKKALPTATLKIKNRGDIVVELYPETAPETVKNFLSLVESGYYDGLIFHRVIPGFMIQGGDPTGTGTGGPGYNIKGEFAQNGFKNDLKHTRGVISMARSAAPDSAGSQFFLMHQSSPHLDGAYAGFGRIISGIEIVDAIAAVPKDGRDKPLKTEAIEKATADTKGVLYGKPEGAK